MQMKINLFSLLVELLISKSVISPNSKGGPNHIFIALATEA